MNKKSKIMVFTVIAVILIIIISAIIIIAKQHNAEKVIEPENNPDKVTSKLIETGRVPDKVITKTDENNLELNGFEVENIEIFKVNDTTFNVRATIINKTNEVVKGVFAEIGLFDKNDKQITVVAENCQEEILPNGKHIIECGVSTDKDELDKIESAKITSIEKEIKTNEESLDGMKPEIEQGPKAK